MCSRAAIPRADDRGFKELSRRRTSWLAFDGRGPTTASSALALASMACRCHSVGQETDMQLSMSSATLSQMKVRCRMPAHRLCGVLHCPLRVLCTLFEQVPHGFVSVLIFELVSSLRKMIFRSSRNARGGETSRNRGQKIGPLVKKLGNEQD